MLAGHKNAAPCPGEVAWCQKAQIHNGAQFGGWVNQAPVGITIKQECYNETDTTRD